MIDVFGLGDRSHRAGANLDQRRDATDLGDR